MHVTMKTAVVVLLAASSLFACRPSEGRTPPPRFVWSGGLAMLDGRPTADSGIRLDIQSTGDEVRAFSYRLSTGCSGEGFVDRNGVISASESMRPCRPPDMERIARLNMISGSGLPSAARSPRLTWTTDGAVLASSEGEARFTTVR